MRYSKKTPLDVSSLSDVELLRASKKDPRVFAELVRRYESAFMRKALSILPVPEDAEEVVQDAFTRIYLYADRYQEQEGASFSSWAYFMLTRLCFTRYQKCKKERGYTHALDPEVFERLPDHENFLDTVSMQHEVLFLLSKLPERLSRVLRLQFLEGKTQEEIAQIEGTSVSAIKTRVFRAKQYIKKEASSHTTTYE